MSGKVFVYLGIWVICIGCGDSSVPNSDPLTLAPEQLDMGEINGEELCVALESDVVVSGYFFDDLDISERSAYTAGRSDDDAPLAPNLTVLGATPDQYEVSTCAEDGRYEIGGLSDGVYLVAPTIEDRECSTNNCSSSFVQAIEDNGRAVMVTFGDSLAVYGEAPMFPDRFATLIGSVAEIENRNVAIAGTTSNDWLPEGNYFQSRLAPHLADADLIVITVGGNDLMELINDAASLLADIPAAVVEARRIIRQVITNLEVMIEAIRTVNPNVDIAFCLYPDYTQATGTIWQTINNVVGQGELALMLEEAREAFPSAAHNLILVDVYGAAKGIALKDYLWTRSNGQIDPLHFSALGHVLYAEELFKSLGGVLIGDSPLGELGHSPLGVEQDFGFVPVQ